MMRKQKKMKIRSKPLIVGFSIAIFLGVAVYIRLWTLDSKDASFTSDDRENLRRQFERANLEAMDESAEWRVRYDEEVERNKLLQEQLNKVKDGLVSGTKEMEMLRKEKAGLQMQVESLRQKVMLCSRSHPKDLA